MVPIYKGKGDILECNNYRGIKLMCHSMKLWERLIEARLRQITSIGNTQYGFRPGKSTTEPIFILQILQEKYREMNKELHMVFVDLEKAYDRVPRDLIWWCLRKKGVPEGYITIIQDMYNDCETLVSTRAGDTEYFQTRSWIAPRVCIKSTSLYTHHGCATDRDRKGTTMGDVVCR